MIWAYHHLRKHPYSWPPLFRLWKSSAFVFKQTFVGLLDLDVSTCLKTQNRKPNTRRLANAMVTGKMLNVVTWNAPWAEEYYGFCLGEWDEGLPPNNPKLLLEARRFSITWSEWNLRNSHQRCQGFFMYFSNPAFLTNVLSKNVPHLRSFVQTWAERHRTRTFEGQRDQWFLSDPSTCDQDSFMCFWWL